MYGIEFFMDGVELKERILAGETSTRDAEQIIDDLETLRDKKPHVFNIETTNYCNMTCVMCPRTTLMTRKNEWIDDKVFEKVLDQVRPYTDQELKVFWDFIEERYGVTKETQTENGFYFHIVARHVTLHGYGEPLLDKYILDRVRACTKRNIPTYFSCVPANINIERIEQLMELGLGVLKFSVDALDDEGQKKIRGKRNDFTNSFENIQKVIDLKHEKGFETKIVVTMIAMGVSNDDLETQRSFMELFDPLDVFNYVKSQDNRWYYEGDEDIENKSHYVSEYCEYPWTSLTVMANGEVVPCTQDFDTEMTFGNVRDHTLEEIWNSEAYKEFRRWHVTGDFPKGNKCNERCDLPKIYHRLQKKLPSTEIKGAKTA
jgi:radical SAM protein with 4Fe4S-binding SPASM domain